MTEHWVSGEAVCLACKHEYMAVAPTPVTEMECPNCGLFRSQYKYPIAPNEKEYMRKCDCDSVLFYLLEKDSTLLCQNCGEVQSF